MVDWKMLMQPEAISLFAGLLLLLFEILIVNRRIIRLLAALFALIILLSSGLITPAPVFGFSNLAVDSYTVAARFVLSLLFFIVYLYLTGFDSELAPESAVFYALGFFALAGGILMILVRDLISLLIVLEISSIATYAMAASYKTRNEIEAVTKYFLFGGLASGLFVIGVALLIFLTGGTSYETLASRLAMPEPLSPLYYVGLFLIISAFAYKIAIFPWQLYAPDFYEGQNLLALTFNATIPKAAGFAALVSFFRLFPKSEMVAAFFTVMVVVSWFYTNLSALAEKNVLRILAFSSIAHAGFIAASILLGPNQMERVALLYILSYGLSTAALTGSLVAAGGQVGLKLENLRERLSLNPLNMFLFLLAVVSLAGVPPLPIFFAKYYLFKELVESGFTGLVIVGAVFSAVSLGYYLNLIKNAFLIEAKEVSVPPVRGYPLLAASLSTLLLLFFVAYLSGFLELLPPA